MQYDYDSVKNSFGDMPIGEPFICSFSGGKDSVIALSKASEKGDARGILHWRNTENNHSIFHEQDLNIVKSQAEHMGLPLVITNYSPWKHRLQLVKSYQELASQGVKSVIFGDIYIEDSVKVQNILCSMAGLVPRYPLWGKTYDELMEEFQKRRIKAVITRVNTAKLSDQWLGKIFDKDVFDAFCKLKIDPFGEKGEYHSTVVDADIFKKAIKYSLGEDFMEDSEVSVHMSSHHLEDNVYRLL